jgi:predicted amidohydrolase YtcJ
MSTNWAAEYVLKENLLGSLERGKFADLIVLNRDYLTVPEKDIGGIKVLLTLVGGKIVHQNEQF